MLQQKEVNAKYMNNGIVISPAVPAKGETAKIVYNGLLAQNGAEKVYIHFGFGNDWEKVNDYRMVKTEQGFVSSVPVASDNTMNICFKDNIDNWDNNSGQNYSFTVV